MRGLVILLEPDDDERRRLVLDLVRDGWCVLAIANGERLLQLLAAPESTFGVVIATEHALAPLASRLRALVRQGSAGSPFVVLIVDPERLRPHPRVFREACTFGAILRRPITRAALVAAVRDAAIAHLSTQDHLPTPPFGIPSRSPG